MTWIVLIECELQLPDGTPVLDYIATETLWSDAAFKVGLTLFEGVVAGQVERGTQVSVATMGGREASSTFSRIDVCNIDGSRSHWRTCSIEGLPWRVYLLQRGRPFTERVRWFTARGKAVTVVNSTTLGIMLTDRSNLLDRPLQAAQYGDAISNVSLRGRPRPLALGAVFQAPALQPEITGDPRFDVTDATFGGISAVYDNGVVRDPVTQWAPSDDPAIHGFELLTARGGRLAADLEGNLTVGNTDVLGGAGAFSSLTGWTTDTTAGTVARCWDAADLRGNLSLSSSDRLVTHNGGQFAAVRANRTVSGTQKRYWECQLTAGTVNSAVGVSVAGTTLPPFLGHDTTSWGWLQAGTITNAGVVVASGYGWSAGQRLGFAYDPAAWKLWLRVNGTWVNGDPVAGTGGLSVLGDLRPAAGLAGLDAWRIYPSSATVAHAAPSGWLCLEDDSAAGTVTLASGKLQLVSNGGNAAGLSRNALTIGVAYQFSVELSDLLAGALEVVCGLNAVATLSVAGTWTGSFIATSTAVGLRRRSGAPANLKADNFVVKVATLSRTLGGMLGYIASRTGVDLDAPSVSALQAAAPYSVGMVDRAGRKAREALTEVMDSWLGWAVFSPDDVLCVGRLRAPEAAPVLTVTELELAAPIDTVRDDASGLSNLLLAGRNWEVFQDSELPTGLDAAQRAVVTAEYRYRVKATSGNTSEYAQTRVAAAVADRRKLRNTEGMPTLISNATHALTECNRRWSMYDQVRHVHSVAVLVEPVRLADLLAVWLGDEIHASNAQQPEFEYGVDLIVIGRSERFPAAVVTFKGWG